ncbi:ATP-binding cassette domain-containing protein [Mesorhizobium sp. LNJC384A00]|uniref:ATP-binding cassette domain-containing protein n=1 Tax=Mesorhizobium sp. LNJC384A00 TaxID=1287268 RepID=UPI001FD8805A|nr:ATP-binding cassette domain-containing protein [Mesorhizobium sp. LNJC384A00]
MPDTSLNSRHRVREVLGRPLTFYHGLIGRIRTARIIELLEQIELNPTFLDRFPEELSGGQKQRLCIARALAAKPDLIICDEVTSALDQSVAQGILRLLLDLQKNLGISYLFITHDLQTVRAIADEVVVMNQGRIVEQGPKDEFFAPPHHPYTQLLLTSVPQMDPDWLDSIRETRAAIARALSLA